jgi:hypothetical protein
MRLPRPDGWQEARLVFLTAAGPRADERMRDLLAGELDWSLVGWLAERENATRHLHRRLAAIAPDRMPAELRAALHQRALVTEFRQSYLQQRLEEAVRTLAQAGIDVLLLKGAALVQSVYRSFEDRPMGDLDLLVHREQAWDAQRLLCAHGWARLHARNPDEYYEGHSHLPPLDDARGTGIGLELHTDLFVEGHPFRLQPAQIWSAADAVDVGGVRVFVPSITHLLLHNCLHFAWSHLLQHGAWRCFLDTGTLLASGRVDWDDFLAVAHETRAATCSYWTLRLARVLADIAVPERVLEALRPPRPRGLEGMIERHFVACLLPPESRCPSERIGEWFWEAAIRPRWSGHRNVRPWQREHHRTQAAARAAAPRFGRLRDQMRKVAVWKSYLGVLLRS